MNPPCNRPVVILREPVEAGLRGELADRLTAAGLHLADENGPDENGPDENGPDIDVVAIVAGPPALVGVPDFERHPALRIVAACSTGTDHIDVEGASRHGVIVTNVADYCTDEVADHALALTLALLREVPAADRAVRRGRWDSAALAPRRLVDCSVGLVGFGRIAQALARRVRGLGMAVHAYDPRGVDERFAALGARRWCTLPGLLAAVDVVSLHVPLTPATHGLIDAAALAEMRPGSVLINVARGGLVDEPALVAALNAGHLAGAALDVLSDEPPAVDNPLLAQASVLLSPHIAWASPGAHRRAVLGAADCVILALARPVP